ncbi:hypothetical protein SINU_03645 [Sporolactobacillus inulinus CASD]|uniref:Uncharacterized protein n=1 Tax=Sporolactobacillus inulinus CASD TaxID=1069536 RepID=A0A0U1QR66_9BACL|nr:hypothetical protein SINU_03645 [Sporolactobacillus inulinus CASD]
MSRRSVFLQRNSAVRFDRQPQKMHDSIRSLFHSFFGTNQDHFREPIKAMNILKKKSLKNQSI